MAAFSPHPAILLASPAGSPTQAIIGSLRDQGFRVTRAHDERETIELAHQRPLHAIIVDSRIAPPGHGICMTLRTIALATPLLLVTANDVTRAEQVAGLKAGAWDVFGAPLDVEQLLLRIHLYLEPKLELDRISEECLVDRVSGLYNPAGLARRAAELAALATRHGLTLACAAFRPAAHVLSRSAGDRMAQTFKNLGRASDAIGRTGMTEFAVFAPATNTWAASRLVRRIADNVEREWGYVAERGGRIGVLSGFSAAQHAHRISPATLLARARSALEAAQ
jgi:DNA-binding response OmpR family regulator